MRVVRCYRYIIDCQCGRQFLHWNPRKRKCGLCHRAFSNHNGSPIGVIFTNQELENNSGRVMRRTTEEMDASIRLPDKFIATQSEEDKK